MRTPYVTVILLRDTVENSYLFNKKLFKARFTIIPVIVISPCKVCCKEGINELWHSHPVTIGATANNEWTTQPFPWTPCDPEREADFSYRSLMSNDSPVLPTGSASGLCRLCHRSGPRAWKGPAWLTTLHFSLSWNPSMFWTKVPPFPFCTGPCRYIACPNSEAQWVTEEASMDYTEGLRSVWRMRRWLSAGGMGNHFSVNLELKSSLEYCGEFGQMARRKENAPSGKNCVSKFQGQGWEKNVRIHHACLH